MIIRRKLSIGIRKKRLSSQLIQTSPALRSSFNLKQRKHQIEKGNAWQQKSAWIRRVEGIPYPQNYNTVPSITPLLLRPWRYCFNLLNKTSAILIRRQSFRIMDQDCRMTQQCLVCLISCLRSRNCYLFQYQMTTQNQHLRLLGSLPL